MKEKIVPVIDKKNPVRRLTIQKIKILDYLKKVKSHPNAEEVYNNVKKELPTITLATVYRNLNLLAEEGIIQRLEINHEYRYDAHCDNHQHFICTKSGKVFDIHDENINDYLMSKIDKDKFDTESVMVIYKGKTKNKGEIMGCCGCGSKKKEDKDKKKK
ncbi:MAG: Fur family transcriptional regulator [Candidatus Woesearchaeota archaeon]